MPGAVQVNCIEPDGQRVEVQISDGWSLMQGAKAQGVQGIDAECGGACSCATCHCYVAADWLARLPPPAENEAQMLVNVAAERRVGSRLACQIKITAELDGLVVEFPARQA
jgi:2Fe-2S ferredoxin